MALRRGDPVVIPDDDGVGPHAHTGVEGALEDEGRVAFYLSQDGLRLAARIFDAPDAKRLPMLCLPGLSRNSRDFLALATSMSRHPVVPRKVLALDYRGRGLSAHDRDWKRYTPLIEAQDVLAAAAAFGIERAVIVGTSRGGIIAMMLGALRPGLIAGAVLNDIGPVVEGTGLARIKKYLAARKSVSSWDEAIAAVRAIGGSHFPALTDEDWRAWAKAVFAQGPNGLEPQFDPNLVRTLDGVDFSAKIPALWPQFMSLAAVPVLAIRGENSDIMSTRTLAEMAVRHTGLEQLTVRGQGHAPLLRDQLTLERIAAFAQRCESGKA